MATLTADPWTTLPTNWRTRPTTSTPYVPPLPELTLPETTCHPRCRRCHHPEGRGHCRTCVLVCDQTTQPAKRKPVDICLTRTRAVARTARSPGTGRQLLVVDHCPYCHHPHVHSAHPGVGAYRRSGCGNPYVLEIRR